MSIGSASSDRDRPWLDRKAGHELDQRFGLRLDPQQHTSQRMEATLNTVAEVLALFVHLGSATAPHRSSGYH